jgi:hypothetical protein
VQRPAVTFASAHAQLCRHPCMSDGTSDDECSKMTESGESIPDRMYR